MTGDRTTIRTVDGLVAAGLAPDHAALKEVAERYAIAISPAVRRRVGPGPDDPVAAQFVPTASELIESPDELTDPIGDDPFTPVTGVTHRYRDRVLLKPLGMCPVYCRFCFRREAVGPEHGILPDGDLAAALDYIRGHEEVWEVILTGGDPLMLPPARLERVLDGLDAIAHVKVVRIHTRVPVVSPERVRPRLLSVLRRRTPVWIVLHCNHRQEIGAEASAALGALADGGIPLLSQTVLLRGVNDSATALEELFRELVENRVKPYYLHHADLARGTGHFRTGIEEGRDIVRRLRGDVSGLCQPTYVLDIPGGHGKVPLADSRVERSADGSYLVTDRRGARHRYPPVPEGTGQ
ncbi:lysine-2,3-aminomutase-like protein [Streptomyces sp. NPDC056353]|uniref:lysine-2,3-aminomutase-like protein n=1 Tax=unclassified Streptomyces TaxID=2593676 RepID=UPI0013C58933|nr:MULTISPECIES: lysine-2,3-aminomutase-like protein [unclassified Streptomyces]NDZ71426.1 lysine-2,3-aminomutase-like protein [Streptomyces sp. SID10362]QUW95258.1 L-lysine 2,3-aminomutase [Streptomyces sp. V17-9]